MITVGEGEFTDISVKYSSKHWVLTPISKDLDQLILTGVIPISLKGKDQNWYRDTLQFYLALPLLEDKAFNIQHWAPFITINAIYNKDKSVNAGWAVDDFWGPGQSKNSRSISFFANIAIRDADGYLLRIGYNITLLGKVVDRVALNPDAK